MDESLRLLKRPMPADYDVQLFNQIYKDTKSLRNKLAYEIDGKKFGVDYQELKSWFDVKFIFAFNTYYGDPKLKGYIINTLKTYKKRIVLNSYGNKQHIHNTVDITEVYEDLDKSDESEDTITNGLLSKAKAYMKDNLSEDAFFILELELNPPPYIIQKLHDLEHEKMPKIPTVLIADFLGIDSDEGIDYVDALRYEIKQIIIKAKDFFSFKS